VTVAVDGGRRATVDDLGPALLAWAVGAGLPPREARWILEEVDGPAVASGGRESAFRRLAERRLAGEPLQYVLGTWPFRSIELQVDRRVLIPRPETERVVEVALAELHAVLGGPGGPGRAPLVADLGTGSGAIALSLAVEAGPSWPGLEVWATDRSAPSLEVAATNLAGLSERIDGSGASVRLAQGWWFSALPPGRCGEFDLVVSNPPYVAGHELAGLDAGVREWEPESALVAADGTGGAGGMADVEAVVAGAARWLRPGGALVVEIAPHQADAATGAAHRAGLVAARTEPDLAGRTRMLVARR